MEDYNDPQVVISQTQKDNALCRLVYIANAGAGIGITLLVEGQVVYGDLMSGKDYCQEMYESLISANGPKEVNELMANGFKEMGEEYYSTENLNGIPLNYLHLKNVAYLKGDGGMLIVNGSPLRVAIEKVSGFAVGRPS